MRITTEQRHFFKIKITAILPDAKIYLFGSRADDAKRGGDTDILVIAKRPLNLEEKSNLRKIRYNRARK